MIKQTQSTTTQRTPDEENRIHRQAMNKMERELTIVMLVCLPFVLTLALLH
jgi:hypothetical protein